MPDWVLKNYLEIIGSISGLVYILLSIRQNISLWAIGFLTSAFYIAVYFTSKLYANMALQGYYLVMSVYGWYVWKNVSKGAEQQKEMPVRNIPKNLITISIIAGTALMLVIYLLLKYFTDSTYPVLDSFTTTLGVVATWMLARKFIENWLLWILADCISVGLYLNMRLYPTTILFLVYTIMAVVGYLAWKKTIKNEQWGNLREPH